MEKEKEKNQLLKYLDSDDPEIVLLYLNIIENEYGEDCLKKCIKINKLKSVEHGLIIKYICNKQCYFYKVEEKWIRKEPFKTVLV
jgi:hypothetical protein